MGEAPGEDLSVGTLPASAFYGTQGKPGSTRFGGACFQGRVLHRPGDEARSTQGVNPEPAAYVGRGLSRVRADDFQIGGRPDGENGVAGAQARVPATGHRTDAQLRR